MDFFVKDLASLSMKEETLEAKSQRLLEIRHLRKRILKRKQMGNKLKKESTRQAKWKRG